MIPLPDLLLLLLIAATAAAAVTAVGAVALAAVRRRRIAAGLTVLVLTVIGAGAAATSATGLAMFLSGHDLRVLLIVVAVAAVAGAACAALLGRRLVQGVRDVAATARSLADEGPLAVPTTALPAELAALDADLRTAAARLAAARDRERASEASRRELVGWVSHDLRTPLAGLRAMSEALEDGVVSDAGDVADYHRRIRVETDRLTAMVDDLFELSRLHAGTLRLTPVPTVVADLVSDAIATARPVARARGVELAGVLHEDLAVGDVRLLSAASVARVLANLVSNAVRHTDAGGTVTVGAAGLGGETDHGVVLTVRDGCGGIPDGDLPRVFDVGFRGSAARSPRDDGGGGLGLSIARGLVEAAGGSVTVANVEGGCCFTVTLTAPAERQSQPQPQPQPQSQAPPQPQPAGRAAGVLGG